MKFPKSLIWLSQVANKVSCGPKGYTLCARLYEKALNKGGCWWKLVKLVDKIFWFDKSHCRKSWLRRKRG